MRCQSVWPESNWDVNAELSHFGGLWKTTHLDFCATLKRELQNVPKNPRGDFLLIKVLDGILILGVRFSRPPTYLPTYLPTRRNSFANFLWPTSGSHLFDISPPPPWASFPTNGALPAKSRPVWQACVTSLWMQNSRWLVSQCDGLAL
jgi:hypothetical protein